MANEKLVLFQGDSITDAERSRNNSYLMGSGYPTIVAGTLGYEQPGKYTFTNLAVTGNRVVDLYARWKCDCLNLAPDLVSILIGVNDVWHECARQNGVPADRFERVYDWLLADTRAVLPAVQLMVLEPFVLRGEATDEKWEEFSREVPLRAIAAKRVAEKNGAIFVPLQAAFDEAAQKMPVAHWLRDGVHPTAAGHQLIAIHWLEALARA